MIEINEFARVLLQNQKDEFTPDYIETEVYGYFNSDNLLFVLQKSLRNKKIRDLLPDLLFYCNDKSVSVEVFDFVKKYKFKKRRRTLLISLAHCQLSIYQLRYISELNICGEAFAQLLDIYLFNDCFSIYDLENLLIDNDNHIKSIDFPSLFSCESATKIDKNKKEFLTKFINA